MELNINLPKINSMLKLGLLLLILKVYGNASSIIYYNDTIDTLLAVAGVACLTIHCLAQAYSVGTLITYGVFALLGLYNTMQVGTYDIFITVVVCLAVRNENIEDVIEFIFKYECLFFILHMCYAIFKMIFLNESYLTMISGVARYSMGFGHPNRFSIIVFNLLLSWIWLHFRCLNYKNLFYIFIISLVDYAISGTRTTQVSIIILLVILALYMRFENIVGNVLDAVAKVIVPVLAVLSMTVSRLYTTGNQVILAIDNLLSGRVRLGSYAYEHLGLNLLGRDLSDFTVTYDTTWKLTDFTFDNVYTEFCMHQGVLWLILICILFFLLSNRKEHSISFAIIAWAIYGITEVHGMNVFMLFPIVLVSTLFDSRVDDSTDNLGNLDRD